MINDVKSFERSKNIPIVASFWSNDEATSLRKEKMAVSADFDFRNPVGNLETRRVLLRKVSIHKKVSLIFLKKTDKREIGR